MLDKIESALHFVHCAVCTIYTMHRISIAFVCAGDRCCVVFVDIVKMRITEREKGWDGCAGEYGKVHFNSLTRLLALLAT